MEDASTYSSKYLINAAMHNDLDGIKYFIREGVDVDSHDNYRRTGLHVAAVSGYAEIAEELINNGADMNAKDVNGNSPLYLAILHDQKSIVELLLKQANMNKKFLSHDVTYLYEACLHDKREIVKLLMEDSRFVSYIDESYKGSTPLHVAAKLDRVDVIRYLSDKTVNIDCKDGNNYTPLWIAVVQDKKEIVEHLLNFDFVAIDYCHQGETPLGYAIETNKKEIVQLLVKKGADIYKCDRILHLAAKRGILNLVELIIQSDTNVDVRDNEGSTPLHLAARYGQLEVVEFLIRHGADVNAVNKDKSTPLHCSARDCSTSNVEVTKVLVDKGADVNALDVYAHTALQTSLYNGNFEVSKVLIENGNDIDATHCKTHYARYNLGGTLLHWAARNGDTDIVKFLVANNADVNATENDGRTPLCLAVKHHYSDVISFLIANGADLNNKQGGTPLYWAFYMRDIKNQKLLIEAGSDINSVIDTYDQSKKPLHLTKELSVAELLVQKGANVNDIDTFGNTPLFYVETLSIAKFLIDKGADVNAVNHEGDTPLHYASSFRIAELLVSKGAKIHAINRKGYSPLHRSRNVSIAQLLIEKGADYKALTEDGKGILHTLSENDVFYNWQYRGVPDEVNFFVEKGIDVNAVDNDGNTPLHICSQTHNIDVARKLVEYGADINILNNNNVKPIDYDDGIVKHFLNAVNESFDAVKNNDLKRLKKLIPHISLINYRESGSKLTLLHYAVQNSLSILYFLLGRNTGYRSFPNSVLKRFDVNSRDTNDWTPLHYAAKMNNKRIVELLIEEGAIYNARTKEGITPLEMTTNEEIIASFNRIEELFEDVRMGNFSNVNRYIEERKVIINAKDIDGNSPLHWACEKGYENIAEILIKNNANVMQVNNVGNTILHVTTFKQNKKVLEILWKFIEDDNLLDDFVNARTQQGETALHIAAEQNSVELVRSILQHGAMYNVKNAEGKTPVELASDKNILNLLKLLEVFFEDAENGNSETIEKLLDLASAEQSIVMNARNVHGETLEEVIKNNRHNNLLTSYLTLLSTSSKDKQDIEEEDDLDFVFDLFN